MASDKPTGFTITDRRSISPDGVSDKEPEHAAEGAGDSASKGTARDASALPAVDFHTFVLSLGSSALLHLGELEHPESGRPERNLPLAKHTIDILSMLQEKTKGNLTPAEDKLIESLLYDLRLRYVNAAQVSKD